MKILRFIGDVHGKIAGYKNLIKNVDYSIQIGDMGFAREYQQLTDVDPSVHRMIMGNHDDYDHTPPHALGDYGIHQIPGFDPFFFVRGAWSIDHHLRVPGRSWWAAEELSYQQLDKAIDAYVAAAPNIMVTHDCPFLVASNYGLMKFAPFIRTRTGDALDEMFKQHQPRLWIFGHHHQKWINTINGTKFQCLAELEVLEFELN